MSLLRTPPKGVITRSKRATEQPTTKSEHLKSAASEKTASSSAAARKRLEYEAAQLKANIDLDLAQKCAQIRKDLLEKKLEVDKAEIASSKSSRMVESWLEKQDGVASIANSDRSENGCPLNSAPMCNTQQQFFCEHPQPRGDSISQLTEALQQVFTRCNMRSDNKELFARLAISKDLPVFDGDPTQWLQFKESYNESSNVCSYSDAENIWRLRKCLRGEAKEAVSSLLIGNTTPQAIIETLELRFGRPECIIYKMSTQLKKINPLPVAYHTEIVNFAIKVRNYVTAVKAIKLQEYLQSPETTTTILSKLPPALITKWAEYTYDRQDSAIPKLELLSEFLYKEATMISTSGVSFIHSQNDVRRKYEHNNKTHSVLSCTTTSSDNKCMFCHTSPTHALEKCRKFKHAMRRDRWRFVRAKHLCYKCLAARHDDPASCSAPNCSDCGHPHHHLLHWTKPASTTETSAARPAATVAQPETARPALDAARVDPADESRREREDTVAHAHAHASASSVSESVPKVLLKVVPVTVHGPKNSVHTHALLDDGATVTLISADLADQAGLHGKTVTMRARSAWDSGELVCETENVSFNISNNSGDRFNLCARKMKELNLPTQRISCMDFSNYSKYSDYDLCKCDAQPKLLIGQDNYDLIAPILCVKGNRKNEPYVTKTQLGWCVHGVVNNIVMMNTSADCKASDDSSQHRCDSELNDLIRKSFALESIGLSKQPRQNADELRAVTILNNTCELIDNQWFVGLPWKHDNFVMPDSYQTALNRLKSVERKMSADNTYASRYRERIQHLFSNNYARRVNEGESSDHIWYLPHFGVDNPNKKKLRLVFDAAAKTQGCSLNDFLLTGPDLLQSLFGIMFRFRENKIGVIADIKDMFLRIKIKSKDQHTLRFLFRDEATNNVNKYAMTSLIFGANCSPFIAQHIKNKNALRYKDTYPTAVDAICKQHYMDDYIDSMSETDLSKQMINEVSFIHKQGGFEIRNWASNVPDVLENVPKEALSDSVCCALDKGQSERTLGLLWYPASDELGFDLTFKRIPQNILLFKQIPTKREMLCIVMSIFDIHGYLGPFTIKGKILMREIWKSNIEWDDKLNNDLYDSFRKWIEQAREINNIRVPRWYFSSDNESDSVVSLELHLFCDASPSAYAAVAYWRRQSRNGRVTVSFIASKCKVTPLKPVSVPRLELQGAVLACKLANSIKEEHRFQPNSVYYWTDSTTVLHWIKNQCRTYKTFIANRLGEIDELSRTDEWNYVPTALNVADLGTKNNDHVLSSDSEWFTGPPFLYQPRSFWPQRPETKIINDEILEKVNTIQENKVICDLPVPEPTRFSSWLRLLRAAATVLLFTEKCKKSSNNIINENIMNKAELLLLRYSQAQSFQAEINSLKLNKEVKQDSRLRSLTPILDENNLLRVGSRIGNAKGVDQFTKYPIILDGKDHIARLIVKHYHISAAHSSNEMVVNELRQRYWLVRLRPTVRSIAKQCLICRFRKAIPSPPRLGDLPECRLEQRQRPFTMCGVDLFGPIEVVVGRQRVRRYGVLFTCLTVRAVHIEVVSSLTTDSMIMALRRMAARRGWPRTMFSDNGTNLRGADTELKKAYKEMVDNQPELITQTVNKGIEWRFIPPASPHMGGAWERLIRSVKTALKVVLKERAPKEETLITFLCEVENIINGRPLTHVSVDPRDPEALTPNHFLLGSSSNLPQIGTYDDKDLLLNKQWRTAQRLADLFWSRWLKEVLPTLAPRKKWDREGVELKVGDLVVVVDPSSPRNTWPRGIIQTIFPGADGRVRTVDVKTKTGVIKRPASRIALLLRNECRDDTEGEDVGDRSSSAPK